MWKKGLSCCSLLQTALTNACAWNMPLINSACSDSESKCILSRESSQWSFRLYSYISFSHLWERLVNLADRMLGFEFEVTDHFSWSVVTASSRQSSAIDQRSGILWTEIRCKLCVQRELHGKGNQQKIVWRWFVTLVSGQFCATWMQK